MSIDSSPSIATGGGGEISHPVVSGSELGAGHLAETQLSSHADIAAARNFFQPAAQVGTPAFTTGAEGAAMAGKAVAAGSGAEASAITSAVKSVAGLASAAGSEAAAMGAHAMAQIGTVAAGAAEVSPMIQLIMRLPGLGGVAQDFFDWLMALFTAPEHLMDIFDPEMWARLGASLQTSISNLAHNGISAEHFQVPLNMLPGNAPFLQQLGLHANSMSNMSHFTSAGGYTGNSLSTTFNLNPSHMNVSSPLDLRKPQFEMGQSTNVHTGMSLDGKMSGPQMNSSVNPSFLSGTQRLFSDQVSQHTSLLSNSSTSSAGNFVSNTSSPAGNAGSGMNISSNNFSGTQDMGATPANYRMSDGVMSGPSVSSSNNAGFHLSDSAPAAAVDKAQGLAPSGAVSDTLGGKELLASNEVPSYQPSMGGSYFRPAQAAPSGDSAASSGGLQELKAEPMQSLLKKHPAIGHTPDRGAVDYIGHQSKGALHAQSTPSASPSSTASPSAPAHHTGQSMDQISHRGSAGHANVERQIASKEGVSESVSHTTKHAHQVMDKVSHAHSHHVAHAAAKPHVERAASAEAQPQAQSPEQAASPEQTAMADAGSDKVSNYTVQHGDNLWDIAKKQLGDGSRWGEIYKMNQDVIGANPDLIHSGLDLKMPGGTDATPVADAGNYTVQPGDNLWDIAKDKLGDGSRWGEIYHANQSIIGENPRMIMPGEQLAMPGAQTAISQAPAAAAPTPVAMQAPTADPNAAVSYQQMAPQEVVPQTEGFQAQIEPQPIQPVLSGPGAAGAATLDPSQMPSQGPVSRSLAPDLSWLYTNKK